MMESGKPWTNGMQTCTSLCGLLAAYTLIFQCFAVIGQAVGADHYCSKDPATTLQMITGERNGSIFTRYENDTHYRDNQNCVWLIDAGPNSRVEITVISSDLQWAPESAICPGYDHVAIKDVNSTASHSPDPGEENRAESIVLQWCGHRKPLGAVSSGRYLRVEFMSDKNNPYQYTGVHLQFQTFSSSDCAPSWHMSQTDYCFKLLGKETDWSSAQRQCNAEHANLASILSESEHEFVLQTYSGERDLKAWIGLNDIVDLGSYRWIDESDFSFDKFPPGHSADQYSRCVALNFKEKVWSPQDCEEFKAKPLCKSKKGEKTRLFAIPQEKEEDSGLPFGLVIGIVIALVALAILVLLGVVVYCRIKGRRQKPDYRAPRQTQNDSPRDPQSSGGRQEGDVSFQRSAANNRGPTVRPNAPPLVENSGTQTPEIDMALPPPYEEVVDDSAIALPFKTGPSFYV